jgi:hypothetical protein
MENTIMSEKEYYEISKYLSQQVGKRNKFLQKTACMDMESRRLMAVMEFIKMRDENHRLPENERKSQNELIAELFKMLGWAMWERDVLTDMGLLLGMTEKRSKVGKKDAGKV